MTKIMEIPINDRPVERLINKGSNVLANDELLAIILKTGTYPFSSKDLGLEILKIKNINELIDITYEELIKIKGIGSKKAAVILACIELSKRMNQKIEHIKNTKMNHPELLFNYYKELLKNKKQEYFYAIYLDIKNIIIKDKLLFIGTINYSMVHPREVFKEAYVIGATSIVILHNHPSNDVTPSNEDYTTTKNLIEIGKLLGIKVIDHIIVGKTKYYSFCENGDIH